MNGRIIPTKKRTTITALTTPVLFIKSKTIYYLITLIKNKQKTNHLYQNPKWKQPKPVFQH